MEERTWDAAAMVDLLQGHGYEPVGALFRHAVLPVTWRAVRENAFPLDGHGVFDILFRAKGGQGVGP